MPAALRPFLSSSQAPATEEGLRGEEKGFFDAVEMAARVDNDLPEDASAGRIREAREALNQSIAAGMSLGDLADDLRALGINAVMSSDDINQFFHMPVPADTMLLADASDRHEDTVPVIRLPLPAPQAAEGVNHGDMSIVAWKADLDAYLALQAEAASAEEDGDLSGTFEPVAKIAAAGSKMDQLHRHIKDYREQPEKMVEYLAQEAKNGYVFSAPVLGVPSQMTIRFPYDVSPNIVPPGYQLANLAEDGVVLNTTAYYTLDISAASFREVADLDNVTIAYNPEWDFSGPERRMGNNNDLPDNQPASADPVRDDMPDVLRAQSELEHFDMAPDLMAHLRERASIRDGSHPNWSGLSDSVANAQEFVRQHAMRNPEMAEKWAADLRGNPFEYGEALGLESDNIRGIATQMEQAVHRIKHPQLSDLVRFKPRTDRRGDPFSGRVMALQETSSGDVRYHLRAETGPDQGMEGTVYGRDGTFSLISIMEAYGFEHNAPKRVVAEDPLQSLQVAESANAAVHPKVYRGDYLRYQVDHGREMEGVVLDSTKLGGIETLRLRRIYRWPEGAPSMDGADHITFTDMPALTEHVPGAVKPGADLDAIDPLTDAYKHSMGSDSERGKAEHAVLTMVEIARGALTRPLPLPGEQVNKDAISPLSDTTTKSLSDLMVIDGKPMETREFLEERFGSDAAFGVRYIDASTGMEIPADKVSSFEGDMISTFPDGGITNCTNYARYIQKALPVDAVRVVGFNNEENLNSDVVREGWHPGGHDFAIVDNRYLVDPWAKLLAGVRDRVVYDLQDETDARLVAQTYGSPGNWSELPETGGPRNGAWDRKGLEAVVRALVFDQEDKAPDVLDAEFSVKPVDQQASRMPEPQDAVVPSTVYPVRDFIIPKEEMANFERRVYVGDKKKARNNLEAIRLVQYLHETYSIHHHGLSPEEQATLSAYVGWGGLPKAFRDPSTGEIDAGWEDIVEEMESLLSDEDLKAARRSTLDAHYTAVNVISAMWAGLEAAGFKGGAVMEPAMGTGLFFALQPEGLKASSLSADAKSAFGASEADSANALQRFGIEMDATSARISRWLYPESRVDAQPFQNVNDLEGMMDVVIGNPPFGDQSVFDPVHPEWSDDAPSIHNYFFRKGLEQLQPGGVQAFAVSRYFLDAGDTAYTEFRQRLHRDAELLTAVRLPRNAFMANAGTQVVTDVIFFRKRMEPLLIDEKTVYPDWVSADGIIGQDPDTGRGVPGNRYYEKHLDHLMGIPALGRGMYREDEPVILPNKGESMDLGDQIRSVIVPELAGKNLVWPESRMLAEARWKNQNRLYPVTQTMKDGTPSGSFFMVYADTVVAREERGFQFADDEDHEVVRERLAAEFPPRLAVRTSGYRGFAFAEEMMVPVSMKKPAKNEEDTVASDFPEEDVAPQSPASGTGNVPMKRAFSDTEIQRVTGMVHIRNALQALLRAQVNAHMLDEDVEARRSALNAAYDTFTKKYGLLNRPINRRVFRQDTFSGALQALEKDYLPEISAAVARKTGEDARAESAEKVALFTERTQYPHQIQDRAENPQDALRLSLSQFGMVDPVFIQSSLQDTEWAGDWSGSIRDALKEDIYLDLDAAIGSEFWNEPMIAWPYQEKALALSGDILDKSERVQELLSRMHGMDVLVGIDEVSRLQEALDMVRPQSVSMKDIGVRFGAFWVDSDIYAQFAKEVMGAMGDPDFRYEKALAKWEVSAMFPSEQEVRWGVQGERSSHWVLSKTLNRQPLLVTQRYSDGSTVVMEKETEIAKQKSQEIQKEWSRWVYSNEAVGERLEKTYNQTFNRFVPPQYDGRHLDLIGSSAAITLRPHQKNAIWRGLQSGKTFFDHAVGAGKTFAAVGLAMEMRRMGRAQKPMVVVPNHLVDQWRGAFLDLYPSAAVLTAMPVDMDGKNRQVFLGKVAYGDWDAVIVPHSLFSRIPPDEHWSSVVMKEEVSGFEDAIRAMQKMGDNADKRTIKQLERKVDRIKSKIAKEQSSTGKKDAGLTMGDIGVDFLFVDEVQEFKNLPYITEMKNVAGLGNPEGSAKAQDLYIKSRSIQKMRADNGGIVYLSGTPLSNTMAELYTWIRHFAYEEMDRMGILHFDAWQNAFADVSRDYAFTLTGQYKEKAYLSVFDNLPELRALTQQFMDTISIADVRRMLADEGMPDMPIPPIAGGKPNVVVCQPTRDQQYYIGVEVGENEDGTPKFNEGSILHRLDNLPKRPEKGEDNILSLSGEMSKVGLDLRAVTGKDNGDEDANNGMKLLRCADEIEKLYVQWADDRGTQLVFLDFSTPVSSRKVAVRKPSATEQGILDALDAARRYEQELEDFGEADDALQQKAERAQELLESISPQELEDVENKYLGGEDRWSAYEALRRILTEKGIPQEEIAFIHEYEKPQEKAELFGMMRSGKLRVLMGSSSKMGAGMNVQDRLVGLHHLDAPYRPLDIEQRNGRGLRQGNKLLEKYGPEKLQLSVNYYVTEGAGDAGRWQILELKKKFIDQYAQRNNGVRRIEDPSAQALDPARIKAESSGSDILMDKTVLSDLSKKLHTAESAWHNALRELRQFIQRGDSAIKTLSGRMPFVKEAAQLSQDWLKAAETRRAALEEERSAAKAARKAERAAKKAAAKDDKETKENPVSGANSVQGANPVGVAEDVTLTGTQDEALAEDAMPQSDTRGPLNYRVATEMGDDGLPVLGDRQNCRVSDMGAEFLKITADLLKKSLRAMQLDRDLTRAEATMGMIDVPLLKIDVAGKALTLVVEDVKWSWAYGQRIPESDDDADVTVCWLGPDNKPVSRFRFIETVRFLYTLDGKEGHSLLREKGTGMGSRILNAVKMIAETPHDFQRALKRETESRAAYQKEYDRLTLKNDGVRVEDFSQQNRLMLVDAMSYCMDTALKGGLRKSAAIDDKLRSLQENHDAMRQRPAEAASESSASPDSAVTTSAQGDLSSTDVATAVVQAKKSGSMLNKIEINLERLLTVAPEIRYWSGHREEIVELLKDEQADDAVFAPILAGLQGREESMESLPYDECQIPDSGNLASKRGSPSGEDVFS